MTSDYVRHALLTAWRVARFDSKAISEFDRSFEGFFRSFFAVVLCAPLYIIVLMAERNVAADVATQMPSMGISPISELSTAVFLIEGIAYLASWAVFPLAMIGITQLIGTGQRYVPFVIAYNWSACIVLAITVVPYIVYLAGVLPLALLLILYYPITIFALVYRWRIARDALETTPWNAAGVVIFDVLLSILIAVLAGWVRKGITGS